MRLYDNKYSFAIAFEDQLMGLNIKEGHLQDKFKQVKVWVCQFGHFVVLMFVSVFFLVTPSDEDSTVQYRLILYFEYSYYLIR